jgi:membrane protease YdiL (CAAX protease family)
MNYILDHPETDLYGRFKNIALGFFLSMIWMAIAAPFFNHLGPQNPPMFDPFNIPPPETLLHSFFYGCISAPFWEEVVFRWFPLYCTKNLSNNYKIPIILASCIGFGLIHGDVCHIWLQGVSGLVIACIYIKNGYHYWSAVILHFLWNYMCIFGFHSFIH